MSVHNICFYGGITKNIPKLSPNILLICSVVLSKLFTRQHCSGIHSNVNPFEYVLTEAKENGRLRLNEPNKQKKKKRKKKSSNKKKLSPNILLICSIVLSKWFTRQHFFVIHSNVNPFEYVLTEAKENGRLRLNEPNKQTKKEGEKGRQNKRKFKQKITKNSSFPNTPSLRSADPCPNITQISSITQYHRSTKPFPINKHSIL